MVCVKAISSKDVRHCDKKMETCAGCYLTSHISYATPCSPFSCHYLLPHSDYKTARPFRLRAFLFYLPPGDLDSFQLVRKKGEECPQWFSQEARGLVALALPVCLKTLKGEYFGCSWSGFLKLSICPTFSSQKYNVVIIENMSSAEQKKKKIKMTYNYFTQI